MKFVSLAGILLIILGVLSLAYQGIHYTTHKQVVQVGHFHATKEEHKTIPLPPILGGSALASGVVLLLLSKREL